MNGNTHRYKVFKFTLIGWVSLVFFLTFATVFIASIFGFDLFSSDYLTTLTTILAILFGAVCIHCVDKLEVLKKIAT